MKNKKYKASLKYRACYGNDKITHLEYREEVERRKKPTFSIRNLGLGFKKGAQLKMITYDSVYLPILRYERARGARKYLRRIASEYKRRKCHMRRNKK